MFRPLPDLLTALSQRRLASGLWQVENVPSYLVAGLRELGWSTIELHLEASTTRDQLLDELGTAGNFADHYGRNWDAAADCLTEISLTAPLAIVVNVGGQWAEHNARDAGILADIIADTTVWFETAHQLAYGLWEGASPREGTPAFEQL